MNPRSTTHARQIIPGRSALVSTVGLLIFGGLLVLSFTAGAQGPSCQDLFRLPDPRLPHSEWLKDLAGLREDLQNTEGVVKEALQAEWQKRVQELSGAERQDLMGILRTMGQAPKVDHDGSKDARQQQLNQLKSGLGVFPSLDRVAVVRKVDQLADMQGLGFLDHFENYDSERATFSIGVQFGVEADFVAIRTSPRAISTTVIDLRNGVSREIPGKNGRLSLQGRSFAESSVNGHFTFIYDLGGRFSSYSVLGKVLPYRWAFQDHAVFTVQSHGVGQGPKTKLYYYHTVDFLRRNQTYEVLSHYLGAEFVGARDEKLIFCLKNEKLKIFDIQKKEFMDAPKAHLFTSIEFPKDPMAGYVIVEKLTGVFGFRKPAKFIYSLIDLNLYPLHSDPLQVDPQPIPGTGLVISQKVNGAKTSTSIVSYITGQKTEVPSSVPPKVSFTKEDSWLSFEWDHVRESRATRRLTHSPVTLPNANIERSGNLIVQSDQLLQIQSPGSNNTMNLNLPDLPGTPVLRDDLKAAYVISYKAADQMSVHELKYDGGHEFTADTKFAGFSYDGRWLAIERDGNIEIHSLKNKRGN